MSQGQWPLQQSDIELIKNKMLDTYEQSSKSFIPCELLESEIKPSYMHKTYFFRILQQLGYKSIRKRWQGKRGVSGYNLASKKIETIISTNAVARTMAEPSKYQSFQGLIKDNKEAAAIFLTDLHIGKSTKSFSYHIACNRLQDTANRQTIIYERDNIFKRCDEYNILLGGDLVDGQGIYPSQTNYQDEPDAIKQAMNAMEALTPIIELGKRFNKLNIYVQAGNHGRTSKYAKESQNWDVLLGELLRMKLGASIVRTIGYYTPTNIKIKNTKLLLYHGDDILSSLGIPLYGITRRALQWHDSFDFDVLCLGHFHKPYIHSISTNITVVGSGTLVSDDDFSLRRYGHDGINKTWFMTFHPSCPNEIADSTPVWYKDRS